MNLVAWMRLGIAVVVAWPFLMAAAAMIGVPSLTALVSLLPILALVIWAIVRFDPTMAAHLASTERALPIWERIRTVVLVELVIGAYLTFVPVKTSPFVLVQLALVVAILALSQAGGALLKLVPVIAGAIFVWLTLSLLWGSLSSADKESLKRAIEPTSAPATDVRRPPITLFTPRAETPTPVPREQADLLATARSAVPGVLRKIYADLNDGNPRAAAMHLSDRILGDAQLLDVVCRPFTYRAHYIEGIAERPERRFEVSVRALFKPVDEHAYLLGFAWVDGRLVLDSAKMRQEGASFIPLEEKAQFGPDLGAAQEVARKLTYASMAGERDVAKGFVSPTLEVARFLESPAWSSLQGAERIWGLNATALSELGLKAHVLVNTARKGGGVCGPEGKLLVESLAGSPKVVAMTWAEGCSTGTRVLFEGEDPDMEARTLRRFGLSGS